LSRFSRAELHRLVIERGVCEASASTIARWLAGDGLKPWQHRSWMSQRVFLGIGGWLGVVGDAVSEVDA
jgi:hypothetical protein